jgi:hypothetical protein
MRPPYDTDEGRDGIDDAVAEDDEEEDEVGDDGFNTFSKALNVSFGPPK